MNSFRYIFFLFLALFVLTSSSIIPEITIKPKSPEGELTLSDLIESVEYLPLETKNNCLIGRIAQYDISENYILVDCSNTESVYLFNRKGEFLTQIGRKGEGPGEYMYAGDIILDEPDNKVIIGDSFTRHLMYYDLKGKFLYTKNAQDMQMVLNLYKGYFIAGKFVPEEGTPYTFEVRDRELRLITTAVKPNYSTNPLFGVNPLAFTYERNGYLYIKEMTLNDTIYQIKNNKFLPYIRVHAGEYEMTPKIRSEKDMQAFFRESKKCVVLLSIAENDGNMFFNYWYQDHGNHYIYYDKKSGKIYAFQSKTGIPNDYDGGIAFWPKKQRNKTWYTFYSPLQFEEELKIQKKLKPKGPQDAIVKFNSLMKKLDPEDNPVLVIVKLK